MEPLKAVVRGGRLILNVATDLPEGSVVELAVVRDDDDDDGDERSDLLQELAAAAREEAAGHLLDFEDVIARLGTK